MTDKQIIIDGVDVSECECIIENYYYQQANNLANGYRHIKNVCELGETGSEYYNLFCKDNPNCHYKQLKRKEKECEKCKQALDEIEELAKHNNFLVRDPFCGMGYRDLSGQILSSINKTKEYTNDG